MTKEDFIDSEVFPFRYYLLVLMAVALFFDQQIVDPAHYELYLFYHGKISPDEEVDGHQPIITGISNNLLLRAARDASKTVGISGDAQIKIERALYGQRISQDYGEALDDWTLVVNKLSRVVTLAPFGCSKTKMTSLQYRNLTRQMLLFLRSVKSIGKFDKDAANQKRKHAFSSHLLPLSTYESLALMCQLSWQLKGVFLYALIPGVLVATMEPFAGPLTQIFLNAVTLGDMSRGRLAFWGIMTINFIAKPLLNLWDKFVVASFVTKLADYCRCQMLNVVLKGGTKFAGAHSGLKLNDAFTNQVK